MRIKHFIAVLVCACWFDFTLALGQDMDKEISSIAEKLAAQVKESGRKKVTVLDFSDLQGNTTELGRFLAEQISVSLVEKRSGFSVMDRANLKTILAEHKLTVEGLVEPENAKKLGQFSGVDAIVLGNATTLGAEVAITAKIIATDTAEIVGAAKGRIPMSNNLDHLSGSAIGNSGVSVQSPASDKSKVDLSSLLKIEKNSQQIGDLFFKVDSLRPVGDRILLATVFFLNTSATNSISVAIHSPGSTPRSTLVNSRGDLLQFRSSTGMGVAYLSGKTCHGEFTDISPSTSIKTTMYYESNTRDDLGEFNPYRMQAEVLVGTKKSGSVTDVIIHNVLIDVDTER